MTRSVSLYEKRRGQRGQGGCVLARDYMRLRVMMAGCMGQGQHITVHLNLSFSFLQFISDLLINLQYLIHQY